MNFAVATVIRTAIANNIKPCIIRDGYFGLINNMIEDVDLKFADSIMQYGGTAIGSARFPEFADVKIREKAVKILKDNNIEALVVIGGDGSYKGALKLTNMGINCVALPGTIDNDIASSDYTIGFDSCLNIIINSIDSIRNTINSHNRCSIIETMGRNCGDLALFAASATGVEIVSISEYKLTEQQIINKVKLLHKAGKRSVIVLVTELLYDINKLAIKIEKASGYVTKANVIGHIQRGGLPSAFDRLLAYKLSIKALDELIQGNGGLCIGIINGDVISLDINKALLIKRKSRLNELKILNKIQEGYLV